MLVSYSHCCCCWERCLHRESQRWRRQTGSRLFHFPSFNRLHRADRWRPVSTPVNQDWVLYACLVSSADAASRRSAGYCRSAVFVLGPSLHTVYWVWRSCLVSFRILRFLSFIGYVYSKQSARTSKMPYVFFIIITHTQANTFMSPINQQIVSCPWDARSLGWRRICLLSLL